MMCACSPSAAYRDYDASGNVSKREFREALAAMGVTAHKAAFEKTFEALDADGSGTIDYQELNDQLRRKTDGPGFRDQWTGSNQPAARPLGRSVSMGSLPRQLAPLTQHKLVGAGAA